MCGSPSSCATLRRYLSQPPMFESLFDQAPVDSIEDDLETETRSGHRMLESRLRSYFWWKGSMGKISHNLQKKLKNSSGTGSNNEPVESAALKRKAEWKKNQAPSYKRRRVRGGGNVGSSSRADEHRNGADQSEQEASRLANASVLFGNYPQKQALKDANAV